MSDYVETYQLRADGNEIPLATYSARLTGETMYESMRKSLPTLQLWKVVAERIAPDAETYDGADFEGEGKSE